MGKFLDTYNLSRFNQEDIENLNRLIINNEIKSVIWSLPPRKSPAPDRFTIEFCRMFKEEQTPLLLKLFQNTVQDETLWNSFCMRPVALWYQNPTKTTQNENWDR